MAEEVSILKITGLKSLVDLSTEAILRSVVHQLHFQPARKNNGPPPSKKKKTSTEAIRTDQVETVRAQLDDYLVSWYSSFRQNLVNQFISAYCSGPVNAVFNPNLLISFFSSVLDHSFKSLKLAGEEKDPLVLPNPTQLLGIVADCSPLLKILDFSFTFPLKSASIDKSFGQSLGNLKHLTSLTLSFGTINTCLDLFVTLGKSFNQLTVLRLGKMPFEIDQVVALMLGDKRALLPSQFPKDFEKLIDVQFTPESLSPICFSLKELHYTCDATRNVCQFQPVAFILRHFRKLEKFGSRNCEHATTNRQFEKNSISHSILHWHKQCGTRKSLRLQGKNVKRNSEELGLIEWTVGSPFTGNNLYNSFIISNLQVIFIIVLLLK